jgi:FkbM family methyltransferase
VAALQVVSGAVSNRLEIRVLRRLARWAAFDRPASLELRAGFTILTSDAQHLAGLLDSGWLVHPQEDLALMEANNGTRILVRPVDSVGRDLCTLFEVFVRTDYGADFDGMTVVDIGAGNGDSTIYFATHGARSVVALEPDPRNAELVRRNLSLNLLHDQVHFREEAVTSGARNLEMQLAIPYAVGHGSNRAADTTKIVRVKAVPIQELLSSLERVDLLKLDVEGAEYEILGAILPEQWRKISAVRMEFHRGLRNLPQLFESHGFDVVATLDADQGLLFATKSRMAQPVRLSEAG